LDKWLAAAVDYIPRWIEFQMRLSEQPGCVIAVARHGKVVLDAAFGHADQPCGIDLTPRHRFRVASHSKSFTSAGLLKLREQGRVRLDDPVGQYLTDLNPRIAETTISQLLSHSAGVVRDGADSGQWTDRRSFLNEAAIRADLATGTVIDSGSRFKYSNHGYALAGLVIEAITGESYNEWIAREVIAASGLDETTPDAPISRGTAFARGHSAKLPLDQRVAIPGENPTSVLSAATGFVSTAADLARFFASLSPLAKKSVLSPASRREMVRRQWRDAHSSVERWYGLGTISGTLGDWDWFGHTGGFQGYITRTVCVPAEGLTVSVLTNAADGMSHGWVDGTLQILRAYARNGAPSRRTAGWSGRWWSLWGAVDLLPMADKVLVATPAMLNPFMDATEIEAGKRDRHGDAQGRIALAGAFGSHGEPVRLTRDAGGKAAEFWLAGGKLLPEKKVMKELEAKYRKR
jgi:D-alanyl-D-alanine carboxypeptidase